MTHPAVSAAPAELALSRQAYEKDYSRWRVRIFIACWTMYATYYLCRANLSVAVPTLKQLDWVGSAGVGWLMTSLYLSYGLGQLVNGVLGDRFGPRRVGTIGMVVSALASAVFGLAGTMPVLMGAWIVNGFAQATGAPSRIKVFSNWYSPRVRGRMMGFLGTDYVFGNVAAWLLSGWLLAQFGWRSVFIVPAGILLLSAIHFAVRVRNTPESVGLPSIEEMEGADAPKAPTATETEGTAWGLVARQALLNPRVWIVGVAYFGVDLFRYGFLGWSFDFIRDTSIAHTLDGLLANAPNAVATHGGALDVLRSVGATFQGAPAPDGVATVTALQRVLRAGIGADTAILKIVMVPFIGAVGIVLSGWLTDRIGGRRAPVISAMLLFSAFLAYVFFQLPATDVALPMIVLGGIGFFLYGPHLLMGATIAMDLGSRKAAATASGVIDALGYMGAALSGIGTTWAFQQAGDWSGPFALWIGGVVAAALLMLTQWNVRPRTDGYA